MQRLCRVGAAVGLLSVLGLTSCDSAPPAAPRRATTQPPAGSTAPAPASPGAHAQQQEPSQPSASVATPAEPPATQSDFLTVVERFRAQERATADARPGTGNELVVTTRNVRRLRIDRERLPLDRRRSISLQLDGQGIEWLPSSRVEEFERLDTGQWVPAKPGPAGRGR